MRTLAAAGSKAGQVLLAVMIPATALAQAAPAPVTQDMDFTPILLGVVAVAVVVLAFALLRRAFRGAAATQHGTPPAQGRQARP